jgi:hypothetical protein
VLELLGRVIPAIVVTECVCRQVVVGAVCSACAVCKNMVGVPSGIDDKSAADMASSGSLGEDVSALGCRKAASGGTGRASGFFALAAVEAKLPQMSGETRFRCSVFGFIHGSTRVTPNETQDQRPRPRAISAKPVGVGGACQAWILTGKRCSPWTRAVTESVSLCTRRKS